MDRLLVVGVNHKQAKVEERERLAFNAERIPEALLTLRAKLITYGENDSEVVLLSTCNRTEIYVRASDRCALEETIRQFLVDYSGFNPTVLEDLLYVHAGQNAACHLLNVASGLDSLIIGENEIQGQVKKAFDIAHDTGTTGAYLSTLFRYAMHAGKRVRTETGIGKVGLSIANVAVELAEEILGPLNKRSALLLGAGKISSITARAFIQAGLHCILVANRTFERAYKLAKSLGENNAKAIRFDSLEENLREADIVICSTGAPHIVLHLETVEGVMELRGDRKLLVVDLALPRDADPRISDIPGVVLRDIDDLDGLVRARHPLSMQIKQQAETIVREELEGYKTWCEARRCAPMIGALRAKADEILKIEIERTQRRMGNLTPEQMRSLEAMGQAIVNKLLHEPIHCIKEPPAELDASDTYQVIQALFGINCSPE
jgi:glutamyl-tRNA reductase